MRISDIPGLDELSAPEKLLLVEDLWESIVTDEHCLPVPESHRGELDRRLAQYRAEPGDLLTLAELRERVQARR